MTSLLDRSTLSESWTPNESWTKQWVALKGWLAEPQQGMSSVGKEITFSDALTSSGGERPQYRPTFTVVVDELAPPWAHTVAEQINRLTHLPPGWNGRSSRPLQKEAVERALDLLDTLMQADTPLPTIVPTNDGGLALEWRSDDVDLEALVLPSGDLDVAYEDSRDESRGWDERIAGDLTLLRHALAEVSERARVAV